MCKCAVLLGILGLSPVYMLAQAPTASEPRLARRLGSIPATDSTAAEFVAIASQARMPGGIVTVHLGCSEEAKRERRLAADLSISEALETLVQAGGPHGHWRVDHGVITLLPMEGVPGLLETRILRVHLSDTANLNLSLSELLSTPEVTGAARTFSLSQLQIEPGFVKLHPGTANPPQQPMDLENVTLMEALNVLARLHEDGVWAYDEYRCKGNSYRINFIFR